jgi:hypothetical protein
MACCHCLAGLALCCSSAQEPALEPGRVNGRTTTNTYGMSTMV